MLPTQLDHPLCLPKLQLWETTEDTTASPLPLQSLPSEALTAPDLLLETLTAPDLLLEALTAPDLLSETDSVDSAPLTETEDWAMALPTWDLPQLSVTDL
uniref:Uncharacterized protein n=1 Tax=Cacopsylla melanoneura TaxID=428564 RepID=A0A8D8LIH7_9HEMI